MQASKVPSSMLPQLSGQHSNNIQVQEDRSQPPPSAELKDLLRIVKSLLQSTSESEGSRRLQRGSKEILFPRETLFPCFISPVSITEFWELVEWLECLRIRDDRLRYSIFCPIDSEGSRQIRRWLHRCETVLKAFTAAFPYDRIRKISEKLDDHSSMESFLGRLRARDAK